MKVSLTLPDPAMPRTVFYQLFCESLQRNPRFTADEAAADLCFPAEDIALETNWPRYGNEASAFLRGSFHEPSYIAYLQRLRALPRPLCIVNMHANIRLPGILANNSHIALADISLASWERVLNPRTISMPALALTTATADSPPAAAQRPVIASFRGAASHPCRNALIALDNASTFICRFIEPRQNHWGKIDATQGTHDEPYADLLRRSIFAFVPRGDCLFSYRLAEALSFGCIPIILSDGWVLPFDRRIHWHALALHIPEQDIPRIPAILSKFPPLRIQQMQAAGPAIYRAHFAGIDQVVSSLLAELESTFFAHLNHPPT